MSAPRLVVLRALGMGDLLTGVPALRALAMRYPNHRRLLAAPAWLGPLVAAIDVVDEHVVVGELEPLPRDLADVEVAVNLHGSGPESHRILLAVRPGRLLAFRHPRIAASADGPRWDPEEHEVARWWRLVASTNGRCLDTASGAHDPAALSVPPLPHAVAPPGTRGATVVHPGAAAGARRWPADRFAAVAVAEVDAGRRVVVTGSDAEQPLARSVADAAGLGSDVVLAGRLPLEALHALVSTAGRVVCGDTGVAHLATAVGTPSVVLFGPTPPTTWGPPEGIRDRHRVLWKGATGDPLGDEPFPGLLAITVEDVIGELAALP